MLLSMASAKVVSNAKLRRLLARDDVNMIHIDIDTGEDTGSGSIDMNTMLKSSRYDSGEYCELDVAGIQGLESRMEVS